MLHQHFFQKRNGPIHFAQSSSLSARISLPGILFRKDTACQLAAHGRCIHCRRRNRHSSCPSCL